MLLSFVSTITPFIVIVILSGIFGAAILPVISTLITKATKSEDQGGMLGISQSYTSLGQIIRPLLAGLIISSSIHWVFLSAGGLMLIGFIGSLIWKESKIEIVDL